VTSAIVSKTNLSKVADRCYQTLQTIDSINLRDPNAEIFILETGAVKPPDWFSDFLSENVKVLNWQEHQEVKKFAAQAEQIKKQLAKKYTIKGLSDEEIEKFFFFGFIKNTTEVWSIEEFFNHYNLENYDKVFKITGRYSLNNSFNLESFNNKFMFKKQGVLKNGIVGLSTTLWCFQGEHFQQFKNKWEKTRKEMMSRWDNAEISDIESSLWLGFGDTEEEREITYIEKLGIMGIVNFPNKKNSRIVIQ
jgi:hypothetical protein